jgi:hypothetical protein
LEIGPLALSEDALVTKDNLSCDSRCCKFQQVEAVTVIKNYLHKTFNGKSNPERGRSKVLLVLTLACVLASQSVVAQTSVVRPQDQGPNSIDVSAYPAQQQAAYKVFASKCSRCHTIARPINTMMRHDEWARDIKRMVNMPNSGITESQGKEALDFLSFDQAARKDKNPAAFFPALSHGDVANLKAH